MPSYYDSTKKKPGKAKLKYAKGRSVKGADPQEQRRREELQQHKDEIAREEEQRAKQEKTAPKSSVGSYTDRWLDKVLNKKKQKLIKTKQGGRVKQMVEGGTVARGSGAARPQRFGRNG